MSDKKYIYIASAEIDGVKKEFGVTGHGGVIRNLYIDDKQYLAIQFDSHDKPWDYVPEYLPKRQFRCYLLGRGKNQNIEALFTFTKVSQ